MIEYNAFSAKFCELTVAEPFGEKSRVMTRQ